MAVDKKISQLTSLAQVDVSASTDVLPIVDTSATETKKITVSALVGAGATAGISGAVLTNGTINSTTIGATTPSTGAFTTLSASGNLTLSGGTANGVLYLNGSKVATSGSALTFDGTNLATTGAARIANASGNKVLYLGQSSPSANDGASFEFQASNTQTNWAIRTNFNVAGALEFCPSSSAGGTTYTSPLMLLSSSGNLGIGTTSPDAKLSVNGVASFGAGTAALPSVAQFGDLDTGRWSPAANTLAWSTGGSERMRIDSSGNLIVGGTSAAQFSLQTNYSTWDSTNIYIGMGMNLYGGASSAGTTFKNSAGLSWTSSYWTGSANATEQFVAGVKRTAASQDSHSWQFWSSSGGGNRQMLDFGPGTLAFYTNGSERMRLDSSGNLGIGTTSPTQLVQARKDQAAYTWMRVENQSSNASAYAGLAIGAFGNSWGWTVGSTAANSNALNLVVDAGGSNSPIATFSTSGNVGIGTTSPSTRLNVVGGASRFQGSGNAGRIEVFDSDNSNQSRILINPAYNLLEPAIQVSTNTPLLFATSNTERMRIDASGNVGINTTSPGSLYSGANNLVVGGGSGNTGMTVYSGTTGTGRLFFADGTVGADAYRGWVEYGHTSNNLTFGTDGATRITVDSSGNVGVGNTPTAGFRLDLQAALAYQRIESTTGTNGVQSRMVNTGGTFYRAIDNSTGANFGAAYSAVLWHTGNYPMLFATNNTERARITASGYFKASTAGTYSSSSGTYHELRVTGADNNWLAVASNTTTTAGNAYGISVQYTGAAPNGTGNQFLNCADTVGTRADIRSNGGLANYQANDVNLSDQRVKKDIKPLGSMWDKFKALEIVTFKYKDQTHDDDNIGVIAQQVESVAPEFIDTDGFGKTPEDGVPLKTVYTTDMYHAAIKALQEAMARIEQLEAKVAVLENK